MMEELRLLFFFMEVRHALTLGGIEEAQRAK